MTESTPTKSEKILVIRMLGLGDVTCIGIPALRFIQQRNPGADVTVLTFAAGKEIIELAEPDVTVIALEKAQWPDDILAAMEVFLGLAEIIVGQGYTQIINLDTWFMPCFLARFLKDAGEPVVGNSMSISVGELIDQFKQQTLSPEYVNHPANYMQSSWLSMEQWHQPWWLGENIPDGGYPEFYLRKCCAFSECTMDMSIDVAPDETLSQLAGPVVAVAATARTAERNYPFEAELVAALEANGVAVWQGFDGRDSMRTTLQKLKATDLLVTIPSAPQWLAQTVGTPSLVISGQVDPRTLMPEYATDMSAEPVAVDELVTGVLGILSERNND